MTIMTNQFVTQLSTSSSSLEPDSLVTIYDLMMYINIYQGAEQR